MRERKKSNPMIQTRKQQNSELPTWKFNGGPNYVFNGSCPWFAVFFQTNLNPH